MARPHRERRRLTRLYCSDAPSIAHAPHGHGSRPVAAGTVLCRAALRTRKSLTVARALCPCSARSVPLQPRLAPFSAWRRGRVAPRRAQAHAHVACRGMCALLPRRAYSPLRPRLEPSAERSAVPWHSVRARVACCARRSRRFSSLSHASPPRLAPWLNAASRRATHVRTSTPLAASGVPCVAAGAHSLTPRSRGSRPGRVRRRAEPLRAHTLPRHTLGPRVARGRHTGAAVCGSHATHTRLA